MIFGTSNDTILDLGKLMILCVGEDPALPEFGIALIGGCVLGVGFDRKNSEGFWKLALV